MNHPSLHCTRTRGLLLLGHGSHYNVDSSRPTHQQADAIRQRGVFDEVVVAFWKEEPNLCRALDVIQTDDVFVIPYFISNGYFTEQIIPREFGLEGKTTRRAHRRVFYGEPVGTHPSMTRALEHCAEEVVAQTNRPMPPLEKTTLVIVGHGTTQNEHSGEAVLKQVELLKRRGRFADVLPAFMEQSPFARDVLHQVRTPYVIVVPFFISDGLHSREDLPIDMGFARRGESWANPIRPSKEKHIESLWYARAIGSEPWMADVILDRVRDLEPLLNSPETFYPSSFVPRGPFKKFSTFTDEVKNQGAIEFGELWIRAEENVFTVCHRLDRDRLLANLISLKSIEEAHEINRMTESGKYRPLRSSPDLKRGWKIEGLSGKELILFLELILPAAVTHWEQERRGELCIRSFREVAGRQSGLYVTLNDLNSEEVSALACDCCAHEHCVRHPLWSYETAGPAPIIEKENHLWRIPCPEPCSYLVAMARRLAKSVCATSHSTHEP